MNEKIFRKKSIDKMSSPDQLTDYIRVSSPGIWMILAAVIIFLAGVCVWGIFGRMDTKLTAALVSQGGVSVCYVKESDIDSVKEGMTVSCDNKEYKIAEISVTPGAVDESISDYAIHLGGLQSGEWVYTVTLEGGPDEGTYSAEIITDSVSPMSFVFN